MATVGADTTSGAVRGCVLPFPIGEKRAAADYPQYDAMHGQEFEVGSKGSKVRLVRLNTAAGISTVGARVFQYTTGGDDEHDVEMAHGKSTSNPCGVSDPAQVDLVDNDLFWVYILGWHYVTLSDDTAADPAVGDYIDVDDDADEGKVLTVTTNFHKKICVGMSLEVETVDSATFLVDIFEKLTGSAS